MVNFTIAQCRAFIADRQKESETYLRQIVKEYIVDVCPTKDLVPCVEAFQPNVRRCIFQLIAQREVRSVEPLIDLIIALPAEYSSEGMMILLEEMIRPHVFLVDGMPVWQGVVLTDS